MPWLSGRLPQHILQSPAQQRRLPQQAGQADSSSQARRPHANPARLDLIGSEARQLVAAHTLHRPKRRKLNCLRCGRRHPVAAQRSTRARHSHSCSCGSTTQQTAAAQGQRCCLGGGLRIGGGGGGLWRPGAGGTRGPGCKPPATCGRYAGVPGCSRGTNCERHWLGLWTEETSATAGRCRQALCEP